MVFFLFYFFWANTGSCIKPNSYLRFLMFMIQITPSEAEGNSIYFFDLRLFLRKFLLIVNTYVCRIIEFFSLQTDKRMSIYFLYGKYIYKAKYFWTVLLLFLKLNVFELEERNLKFKILFVLIATEWKDKSILLDFSETAFESV